MITEFDRSQLNEGYYISSNSPGSGTFVSINAVEKMLAVAFMHGAAACGAQPNEEQAMQYSEKTISERLEVYKKNFY